MTKRQLRAAVAACRAGKARGRFSSELKAAAVEYARTRRREGAVWRQIGDELGVGQNQLSAWSRGGRGAPGGRLREVAVVADEAPAQAAVTMTLPDGAVVSGLDVSSLAALLRALR